MNALAELRSIKDTTTIVGYDFDSSFEDLVESGQVDSYIVATEDGFAPLGHWKEFFSKELGVNENEIGKLAYWNRFENAEVSLIGLPNQGLAGKLNGVVLAASETSICYEQFATPFYGNPYRDFYYNVAYESISYAANILGAKKLAMSHLSASHHFHEDIASCVAEALAHFGDEPNTPQIDSFLFVGCCIEQAQLSGIQRLSQEGTGTRHQDIQIDKSVKNGFDVISLDWKGQPHK